MSDNTAYRADLIHALRMKGGKTRDAGKVFEFCCPRHEDKSPSAWVGDGAWGCHACGFTESLDTLADLLGVQRQSRGYTIEDYALEKGFSVASLLDFGVETSVDDNGWSRITIPYRDEDGRCLRNKFRGAKNTEGKNAGWWEGSGLPIHLYGLDHLAAADPAEPAILVEGESDCHAAWHHGVLAVGVPGANAWKSEWTNYFKGRQVYVWQEPDGAGEKFVESITDSISDALAISKHGIKDLADLHRSDGKNFRGIVESIIANVQPMPVEGLAERQVREAIEFGRTDFSTAPKWGWGVLRNLCGPLLPGELWILGARPGQGKSTFLLNWSDNLAEMQAVPWLFIGMEMDPKQLRRKWSAFRCNLNEEYVLTGSWDKLDDDAQQRIEADLREQAGRLRKFAHFAPARRINLVALRKWMDYAVDHHCRVVIVDHLHQMEFNGKDHRQEMARTVKEAKELAVERQIVLVMAAQLNRGARDPFEPYRIPVLSSLKECGAIEEAADGVLMLSRMLKTAPTKGQATQVREGMKDIGELVDDGAVRVTCRKHRRNGGVATDKSVVLHVDNGMIRERIRIA